MKKARLLTMLAALALAVLMAPAAFADGEVAECDGTKYATLGEAITNAADGATVTLLGNVTEDVTLPADKNITVDGQNQFIITGTTKVQGGTMKNVTLTTTGNSLLTLGGAAQTAVRMENVTVLYPVSGTEAGTVNVAGGNNAAITITRCTFTNNANNNVTENAAEWSYGLYMNVQGEKGSFVFENSSFNGAFRTMLAEINGKVTVTDSTFTNSIYSNNSGSTSGAGEEATCITTANSDAGGFVITGNTFDNAGALYFQKTAGATVTGNTIKFDRFEHYIQVSGGAAAPLDLKNNTFVIGENDLIIIDVNAAPVLLPAGQKAVSYWPWADTPAAQRPADYSSYVYAYNADGTRTFYPATDAAFQAFAAPVDGNTGIAAGDTVSLGADVTLPGKLTVNGGLTILGNGHSISGNPDDKGVYIEVTGGTFNLSDVTLKDFGGNVSGGSGDAVIKVPDTAAADTVVNATNVNVSNFTRSAYDIRSGSFAITGGTINCANNVGAGSENKLTKGILAGLGANKVTGTVKNVAISNSASNYTEWETAGIEVFNNANVTIEGGSITGTKIGIHVDNYWADNGFNAPGDAVVTVSGTKVEATEQALRTYSHKDSANKASVTINGGSFKGKIGQVDPAAGDAIVINGGTFSEKPNDSFLAPGLVYNPDGSVSKPAPKPEEPWTPGPTATPAPAQVLDSTPKTGEAPLAALLVAGLAFAGLGVAGKRRLH